MDDPAGAERHPRAALRVLVVGAGGRDHALCHAFASSPRLSELHAAPGNVAMAAVATCHPDVAADDTQALLELARRITPDLVVVGAEDLLVAGLASRFEEAGFTCLGPSREAARLEGSKRFAKSIMERAGVPTPDWRACSDPAAAHAAIDELGGAVAVKADGLAAGCGAYVCHDREQARAAVDELMVERRFGPSGDTVVVERLVDGGEASVMAIVDGERVVPLPAARDYKRLLDDDRGPNTGGMGAHAPSVDLDPVAAAQLARETIQPVVDELRRAGTPFRGVVYAGVMLTSDGPQVLEYNCRFGNPETQALVRVVEEDLLDLLDRAASGRLPSGAQVLPRGAAVSVCLAAEHYPDEQLEPSPVLVSGLDAARAVEGVELFAGLSTAAPSGSSDELHAAGGRVVTVSAWAERLEDAVARAYEAADHVRVPAGRMRRDIGSAALGAAASRP